MPLCNNTIDEIASQITHEILLEERMVDRYRGCKVGSPDRSRNITDFGEQLDYWVRHANDHDAEKLNHIRRVRGYNG